MPGTPTTARWNPRYIAYAKAHHCDCPIEQMRRDEAAWPGGRMAGFMLWIAEQKRAFVKAHPEACLGDAVYDQAAWDRWLGVS